MGISRVLVVAVYAALLGGCGVTPSAEEPKVSGRVAIVRHSSRGDVLRIAQIDGSGARTVRFPESGFSVEAVRFVGDDGIRVLARLSGGVRVVYDVRSHGRAQRIATWPRYGLDTAVLAWSQAGRDFAIAQNGEECAPSSPSTGRLRVHRVGGDRYSEWPALPADVAAPGVSPWIVGEGAWSHTNERLAYFVAEVSGFGWRCLTESARLVVAAPARERPRTLSRFDSDGATGLGGVTWAPNNAAVAYVTSDACVLGPGELVVAPLHGPARVLARAVMGRPIWTSTGIIALACATCGFESCDSVSNFSPEGGKVTRLARLGGFSRILAASSSGDTIAVLDGSNRFRLISGTGEPLLAWQVGRNNLIELERTDVWATLD